MNNIMENMEKIEDNEYLWNGTDPDWVLCSVDQDETRLGIYNKRTKMCLIIEDENLEQEVIAKMRNAGVAVIRASSLRNSN